VILYQPLVSCPQLAGTQLGDVLHHCPGGNSVRFCQQVTRGSPEVARPRDFPVPCVSMFCISKIS
jgi:hypothetical protein